MREIGVGVGVKELRDRFRALADTTRLRMLIEIAGQGEIPVSDLARAVRTSQPLVSWHLRILRRAALVRTRREGRQVYCALEAEGLEHCRDALDQLAGAPGYPMAKGEPRCHPVKVDEGVRAP